MSVFALFTAAGIDWLNKFKANQQQSSNGATASACEGPLTDHPYGAPQADQRAPCASFAKASEIEARQRKQSRKRRSEGRQGWLVPLRFKQPVIDGFKIQQQRQPNIGGNLEGRWGGRTRSSKISWRTAAPEWQWRSEGGGVGGWSLIKACSLVI